MNDITGYQPKGEPIANPKPPSGGSCIMNHNEAPIADGYYWAKHGEEAEWMCVEVYRTSVYTCGNEMPYDLSDFTFGPRIEPPETINNFVSACLKLIARYNKAQEQPYDENRWQEFDGVQDLIDAMKPFNTTPTDTAPGPAGC